MTRYLYSGIQVVSKWVDNGRTYWTAPVDGNGASVAVTPTFWDASTGGTQITDLTADAAGTTPTTPGVPKGGLQVSDFYGPDGVTSMWLDDGVAGNPRVQVFPNQPNATADSQVAALVPTSSGSETSAALDAAYAGRDDRSGLSFAPYSPSGHIKWRRAYNKKAAGPGNGQSFTVFEASGAGVIQHFWFAIAGSGYPMFDLRIRIYVDGSTTPSVDTDLGSWGGYALANTLPQGAVATENFYAKCAGSGAQTHGGSRIPIPYSNGIKITFDNAVNAAGSYVFSQVDYASVADNPDMVVPNWRLHCASYGIAASGLVNVAGNADATLHTLTGSGALIRHTFAAHNLAGTFTADTGGGGSAQSYLERHIAVSVDGETTPSIKSSGMEDWFCGSFYFTGEMPFSRPMSMGFGAITTANYTSNATLDLLGLKSPIRFTNGCKVDYLANTLATGAQAPSDISSTLFWYAPAA